MNVRRLGIAAAIALAGSTFAQATSPTKPGEAKPAATPTAPAQPASKPAADPMVEQMLLAAKPGEHHKYLAQFAGDWDGTVRLFMPGAPPMESKTACSSKMEFDGRYLYAHHNGEFGGQPFKGVGIMGYNNVVKRFETTWIDNMGTGVEYGTGSCSADGKTFTINSEMTDPTQGKKVGTREVWSVTDADHYRIEFFQAGPDGKEAKSMEIEYARKAGTAGPAKVSKPTVKIQGTAPTETKKPATAPDKK